jgi:hypothetical protein
VRVHARGSLPQIPLVESAVREADDVWRLRLADGNEPARVLGSLVVAGAVIDRFEPLLAPMEDIFLRVVREGQS